MAAWAGISNRKHCRSVDRKGLVQNGLGGRRWRRRDAVHGQNFFFFGWRLPFLAGAGENEKRGNQEQWQETEARLLIHP
jgi:hypothetical protein